jgi:hypothetical protein
MTNEIDDPSASDITNWIEKYVHAWRTNDVADIAALFTPDAEYSETPYETLWVGQEAIVKGWQSRWVWQKGGWSFEWEIVESNRESAIIAGVGTYAELGVFDNVWTVTFADDGRCKRFHMVNTERLG